MEAKKKIRSAPHHAEAGSGLREDFAHREARELIIAFSGPVGSGLEHVVGQTADYLREINYTVHLLKVSDFIVSLSQQSGVDIPKSPPEFRSREQRYEALQSGGNELRKQFGNDILAELVVSRIAALRLSERSGRGDAKAATNNRTAYLVSQLKHPEEVELLRTVYGNLFYLVGVLASEPQRRAKLRQQMPENAISAVMERDRREEITHGQQLEKTLELSDLFLRNSHSNRASLSKQIKRFFDLVHGANGITPTQHEYAMYVAHAAGLRSACLSRQVGAAITDPEGNILATGCNDVPRPGGGLYSAKDGENDHRCVNREEGLCSNDAQKEQLTGEIEQVLRQEGLPAAQADRIAGIIRRSTRLRDLIEFSRSVHAEMDAITTAARTGNVSVAGGYLYTTTFPCHNCARHIIAAGITRVFYIEPYEKSLAAKLHEDAIVLDPEDEASAGNRIQFLHFDGISPRRFQSFFHPAGPRKENGRALFKPISESSKSAKQFLDSYRDFELKVMKNLEQLGVVRAAAEIE